MSWSGLWILLRLCGLFGKDGGTVEESHPIIVQDESHVTGEIGSNWTITCRGHHPVTWYFYDEPADLYHGVSVVDEEDENGKLPYSSTMSIRNVSRDHSGSYYCYYKDDPFTEFHDFIALNVKSTSSGTSWTTASTPVVEKPTINGTFAEAVGVGKDFTLVCSFKSPSYILYQINWTNPVDVINSGRSTIKLNCDGMTERRCDATLKVSNAIKSDADVYVCNVMLANANKSVNHTVIIYDV